MEICYCFNIFFFILLILKLVCSADSRLSPAQPVQRNPRRAMLVRQSRLEIETSSSDGVTVEEPVPAKRSGTAPVLLLDSEKNSSTKETKAQENPNIQNLFNQDLPEVNVSGLGSPHQSVSSFEELLSTCSTSTAEATVVEAGNSEIVSIETPKHQLICTKTTDPGRKRHSVAPPIRRTKVVARHRRTESF